MKISIENLSFSYRHHEVLKDVSLEIPSASLCFLLGENGAGKSTLLKCINYILRPQAGTVRIDGIDVRSMTVAERASCFGYVPQTSSGIGALTVFDTVSSGLSIGKNKIHRRTERYRETECVLKMLQLTELAFRPMKQLSGGERQRVLIARALAVRPKILLLDEPTNNLDLRYQVETMELLSDISHKMGITAAAVIHDLNLSLTYADQAAVLKNGRVYACGRPMEILQKKAIKDAFGVEADLAEVRNTRLVIPQRKCSVLSESCEGGSEANEPSGTDQ